MSLLHSVSVTTAAQLVAEPVGNGDRDQSGVRDTDSRTSITVSSRAHRITLVRGVDSLDLLGERPAPRPCRGPGRPRPARRRSDWDTIRSGSRSSPITSMPSSSSTARRPIAMIGARSPSMTRSAGGRSTASSLPNRAARGKSRSGSLAMPIRSLLARGAPLRAGASFRPDHEVGAAHPGPRGWPASRPRSAVRAITRCAPGRMRSKRKRPSPSVTAHCPARDRRPRRRRPARRRRRAPSRRCAMSSVIVRAGPSESRARTSASAPRGRARTWRRTRP